MSPSDAVVAVRSLSRRYRALLAPPFEMDERDADELARRRPPDGSWSALEHAAHVADVLDVVADAIERVNVHESPEVTLDTPAPAAESVRATLEQMEGGAARLAAVLDRVTAADWTRAGRLPDGRTVTALDLARHAVHVGTHDLRDVERVLWAVRGRPGPPTDEEGADEPD